MKPGPQGNGITAELHCDTLLERINSLDDSSERKPLLAVSGGDVHVERAWEGGERDKPGLQRTQPCWGGRRLGMARPKGSACESDLGRAGGGEGGWVGGQFWFGNCSRLGREHLTKVWTPHGHLGLRFRNPMNSSSKQKQPNGQTLRFKPQMANSI